MSERERDRERGERDRERGERDRERETERITGLKLCVSMNIKYNMYTVQCTVIFY